MKQMFPFRRFLPNLDRHATDLTRNPEVLEIFARHCPILMRDAMLCVEENRKNENLIAWFGFSVPADWLTMVFLYCRRIEKIAEQMVAAFDTGHAPYLSQVKSKFGTLRIYIRYPHDTEDAAHAEYRSRIEAIQAQAAMKYPDTRESVS